jgi:hypothetical protein
VELIKDIGALAGLLAFLGLAVLSMLFFSQARDLRRLREWAGRAPERDAEGVEATSDLAAERAEELKQVEEERRKREQAVTAEREAAELREKRRERREAGLPALTWSERVRGAFARRPGGRGMPEPRYIAVAVGAVIVLGVGVAAAATNLFGGSSQQQPHGAVKPSQIEVAVLNGTNPPVNGLAGRVSNTLESDGFRTGTIGDSSNSFSESLVTYANGRKPEAEKVAKALGITQVRAMTSDVKDRSGGAKVSVILGQDKANFTG